MDIDKLERQLGSLNKYNETGTKYLDQNNYYSTIAEFTKVIESLDGVTETAKKESHPPLALALYLQILSQALIGRQMCYLSVGEKEKAAADAEMFDMTNNLITKINMQAKAEPEKKEEESSCLNTIIGIGIVIYFIVKFFG